VSKGKAQPGRAIALKAPGKLPRVLTVAEAQAILDACDHLRDRFLLAVLWDVGLRIGEALGLRHEDIAAAEREVTIVPRINDNRARSKSRQQRTVPVGAQVIRLYADYLHGEYGDLDLLTALTEKSSQSRGQVPAGGVTVPGHDRTRGASSGSGGDRGLGGGALRATGDPWEPYRLFDPAGGVVLPVAEYLKDLQAAGRAAATQRSYGMDLLRWFRFLLGS